jgi:RNA polymerase sigma-70 factor (ECF subfamily)
MPDEAISDRGFQSTRWSLVAALDQDTPVPDAALARQRLLELCLRYWYPVYLYLRRSGHTAEAAQAITARFFDALLQGRGHGTSRGQDGRFRTFLLAELHRFLAEYALGGHAEADAAASPHPELPAPLLSQLEARCQREGHAAGSPELALRRGFALEVIAQAMRRIEDEARQAGRVPMFAALQPYLASDPVPGDYADIAARLDVSPLFVALALKRLRERFREVVDDELAQTVASTAELDDERRTLHAALQSAA